MNDGCKRCNHYPHWLCTTYCWMIRKKKKMCRLNKAFSHDTLLTFFTFSHNKQVRSKCSKPFFLSHPWYLEVEDWPRSIEWRHQLCHHKPPVDCDNNKLLPCSGDSIPKICVAGRAWQRLGLFSCWQKYLHCPTYSGVAEGEVSWGCLIIPQGQHWRRHLDGSQDIYSFNETKNYGRAGRFPDAGGVPYRAKPLWAPKPPATPLPQWLITSHGRETYKLSQRLYTLY